MNDVHAFHGHFFQVNINRGKNAAWEMQSCQGVNMDKNYNIYGSLSRQYWFTA